MNKIIVLLVLGLMACTKEEVKEKACDASKLAASVVAIQASTELSCKNVDAIKATLEAKLIEAKVCELPAATPAQGIVAQSTVGETLCAPLVEGLFAGGISQLPKEWECTGGTLALEAKAKLIAACVKAI